MTFEAWYAAVDTKFVEVTGLDRDSFPDACYYDMWEDGCKPVEAVALALEEGFGMNLVLSSYPDLEQYL